MFKENPKKSYASLMNYKRKKLASTQAQRSPVLRCQPSKRSEGTTTRRVHQLIHIYMYKLIELNKNFYSKEQPGKRTKKKFFLSSYSLNYGDLRGRWCNSGHAFVGLARKAQKD